MKKFLENYAPWLRNKYVVSFLAFLIWMSFFDRNDLISQYSGRKKLSKLIHEKTYFQTEISNNQKSLKELMSNSGNLEKFAREKYYMKKNDEEIFLIVDTPVEK
jgi:cell division protein DivIC